MVKEAWTEDWLMERWRMSSQMNEYVTVSDQMNPNNFSELEDRINNVGCDT